MILKKETIGKADSPAVMSPGVVFSVECDRTSISSHSWISIADTRISILLDLDSLFYPFLLDFLSKPSCYCYSLVLSVIYPIALSANFIFIKKQEYTGLKNLIYATHV